MSQNSPETSSTEPAPTETPTTEASQTAAAVVLDPLQELRLMIYAVAVFVFLTSLALNLFIYKQNNRLLTDLDNVRRQASQLEQNQAFQQNAQAMRNLLGEIAQQMPAHPEVQQILARYNITVQQQPAAPLQLPPGR